MPEAVHAALREKARAAGMSLSAFSLRVLEREALRPSLEDVFRRTAAGGSGRGSFQDALDALDQERAGGG